MRPESSEGEMAFPVCASTYGRVIATSGAIHGEPFPESHWVFAGSAFADNPEWMGPGEHYVADLSGSVIGLVTFGDEVIGFETVMADQEAVEPMQWKVNTDHVPPIGTPVTIVLSRAEE